MQVIFDASGNQVHNQQLGIDVEDRSPEIHPNGLPLELTGESCIPGINADDVEGIFEEHAIKKEMDPSSCTHGTVYGVTDKVGNPALSVQSCRTRILVLGIMHAALANSTTCSHTKCTTML